MEIFHDIFEELTDRNDGVFSVIFGLFSWLAIVFVFKQMHKNDQFWK